MWRTHRRPRGPEGLSVGLLRMELKRTRANMGISSTRQGKEVSHDQAKDLTGESCLP